MKWYYRGSLTILTHVVVSGVLVHVLTDSRKEGKAREGDERRDKRGKRGLLGVTLVCSFCQFWQSKYSHSRLFLGHSVKASQEGCAHQQGGTRYLYYWKT